MKLTGAASSFRRLAIFCLALAVVQSSSMFAFAAPNKILMGDLTVSGPGENGDPPFVTINGERAVSGRSFASSSSIETPAAVSAGIDLGSTGRITLSPNSILSLNFTGSNISGRLLAGRITVFNAEGVAVNIATPDNALSNRNGTAGSFTIDLSSGKTVAASDRGTVYYADGQPAGAAVPQTKSGGVGGPWVPIVVYAAIVAVAVGAVIESRNGDNIVSPIR